MTTGTVKTILAVFAFVTLGGCASTGAIDEPLLSAAELDAMITVEVRTIEPAPVEEDTVVASNRSRGK